ncbi:hypothetical protein D3C85_1471890 [compost metagenome]
MIQDRANHMITQPGIQILCPNMIKNKQVRFLQKINRLFQLVRLLEHSLQVLSKIWHIDNCARHAYFGQLMQHIAHQKGLTRSKRSR